MKQIKPDETDLAEMAGRMYEAVDLQMAIERGDLTSIDEVKRFVKESAGNLQKLLKQQAWVVDDKCCVDIAESIRISKGGE